MTEEHKTDLHAMCDEALMQEAQVGNEGAFDVLVRRHRERLGAFVNRFCRHPETTEDCTQEIFVKLWLARERYRPQTKFTTYLYSIAVNCCIDNERRRRARPQSVALEEQLGSGARQTLQQIISTTELPERVIYQEHQMYRVRHAVRLLPEHHRAAFVLAHFEQLPYAEIAGILGIPVGTVKSRVYHAVRTLRNMLSDDAVFADDD
jgi:RNA polymerase sigma-70 factor (ECF subfamily)